MNYLKQLQKEKINPNTLKTIRGIFISIFDYASNQGIVNKLEASKLSKINSEYGGEKQFHKMKQNSYLIIALKISMVLK